MWGRFLGGRGAAEPEENFLGYLWLRGAIYCAFFSVCWRLEGMVLYHRLERDVDPAEDIAIEDLVRAPSETTSDNGNGTDGPQVRRAARTSPGCF